MRKTFTEAISDFKKTHNSFNDNIINDKNILNEQEQISNIVEIGEYIEEKNKEDKKEIKQLLPLNSEKILCYFCFKVILQKDCIIKFDKLFCSKKCMLEYEKENYINCKVCSKKMKKIESLPSFYNRNIYYCSLNCLEQIKTEKKKLDKKEFNR